MRELKYAFGETDHQFKNNINLTLKKLKSREFRNPKRSMNIRLAVILAIVTTLLIGSVTVYALGRYWGLMDFYYDRNIVEILPEAQEIIQTDLPQSGGQTDETTFKVREAIFDSQHIYVTIEARPHIGKHLLLGLDAMPQYPVAELGPQFADRSETIADYASENKLEMFRAYVGADVGSWSADCVTEDDGTLVFMLYFQYIDENPFLDFKFTCGTMPFIENEGDFMLDDSKREITTLSVSLQNSGAKSINSVKPVQFDDCGIMIDRVTLTGSEMTMYAKVEYTITNREKYARFDDGLSFDFLDENGDAIPHGVATGSGIISLDDSDTRFSQEISLRAHATLPSEIIMRCFNIYNKDRYQSKVIIFED